MNKFYALTSFFTIDEHQLCVVKLSDAQLARFQNIRKQLESMHESDDGIMQIVVDAQPMIWLPYNEELSLRATPEITGDEWEAAVKARPDNEQPDTSYVHVTWHGLHFSCVTEADNGHTATLEWSELETA